MSLRRRMLLGFLLIGLTLVLTNVAIGSRFRADVYGRVDDELRATAARPALQLDRRPDGGETGRPAPLTDLYIAVARPDGSELTRIGSGLDEDRRPPKLRPEDLQRIGDRPFTVPSEGEGADWRMLVVPARAGRVLVIGRDLAAARSTLTRLWAVQVVGSLTVMAMLAAVLSWVLRLGVRPFNRMAATADAIASGDLSQRVGDVDTRTEAGRLGSAFNTMVARIQEAFNEQRASEERLRRFAADASHELRTPLTSIRGYAELWQAGGLRDPEQLEQAMQRLAGEARRMGGLVDDLLLLARLDQQRPLDARPVRLDLLAADAVTDARAIDPDRPVTLTADPVTVSGDEARLRQVVANLMTNARVHTPAGTPVNVRVSVEGTTARLEVADEGPGLPEGSEQQVFERFHRGDESRVRPTGSAGSGNGGSGNGGGSGLGLSIVDAIVRAHGGRVGVSSTPGRGAVFIVELPTSTAAAAPV